MRYQYLSLMQFLDSGLWPSLADHPSVTYRHQWGTMEEFWAGSTDLFQQRMSCDCSLDIHESRSYQHNKFNLSAYYWWWRGWPEQLRGVDWSRPLPDALTEVVAKLKPAAVIINSGLWRRVPPFNQSWPAGFTNRVIRAAETALAPQNGLVVWRMTTPNLIGNHTSAWDRGVFLKAAAGRPRVRVLDSLQMMQPLSSLEPRPYFDSTHPWPEVYTELNLALLNMLC